MRLVCLTLALSLLLPSTMAFAGNSEGVNSPFYLGAGARDLALGGSTVADPSSSTAAFWNPSALVRARRLSVGASHCRLFVPGVTYQNFSLVVPTLDIGGFGLSLFRLGVDDIDQRDDRNLSVGETSESRLGLMFGYGLDIGSFDLGASLNIEHHSLSGYRATSSPGLDLSISKKFEFNGSSFREMGFGIHGRNVLRPGIKLAGATYTYPYAADAGIMLKLIPKSDWGVATRMFGSVSKVDQVDPMLSSGIEMSFSDLLHVRGGLADGKLSVGAGVEHKMFKFDYAYIDRDLDGLHLLNVSLAFGPTVEEKRRTRELRVEEEFNDYLSEELGTRNREMIASLVENGRNNLENGKIEAAHEAFDDALFIAKTSSLDTLEISRLIDSTSVLLTKIELSREYAASLDSARSKQAADDHLGAKYFAERAMAINPDADEPLQILNQVDSILAARDMTTHLITLRLAEADSLLDYGRPAEALEAIKTIREYSDSMPQIDQSLRRATFEILREKTTLALGSRDIESAGRLVDSASTLYSDHPWCKEMRQKISRESRRAGTTTAIVEKAVPASLSPDLEKMANAAYDRGKNDFENGDLQRAIDNWEEVEKIAPGYKSVRTYLTRAYKYRGVELYGEGELEEAIDVWRKASKLDPDNDELREYIKRCESEIKKIRELSYEY